MVCTACGVSIEERRHKEGPRFCSAKCRSAHWRKKQEREIQAVLEEASTKIMCLLRKKGRG